MNGVFRLSVVTPNRMFEREIKHIRLKDETGFFGVLKNHIGFLTVLVPSLCYYTDARDREMFLAVDGGILYVREGIAFLTSREVHESEEAEKLAETIEKTILERTGSEQAFRRVLEGIERSFMEKTIEFMRQF
jgi:F-type H+-transporting ATPase subunit epsilon